MRVVVERDSFADAVSTILRSTQDQKKDDSILAHVLLRPGLGKLTLTGTDNEMMQETSISAQIVSGGDEAVTVKASILDGIVAALSKGCQISLQWESAAAGVTLKSGRSHYKLATLPAADFPRLREPENPTTFSIPGAALAEHLKAVLFARDKTRLYLSGVAMQAGNDEHPALGGGKNTQLELVACDGHILARTAIPIPAGAHTMPAVILPGRTVGEIVRLSTMHPDLDIGFSVGRNGLVVRVVDHIVTAIYINDSER